jgi:hypothetical protein
MICGTEAANGAAGEHQNSQLTKGQPERTLPGPCKRRRQFEPADHFQQHFESGKRVRVRRIGFMSMKPSRLTRT